LFGPKKNHNHKKIDNNKGNGKMAFASSTINLNQLIPSLESLSVIWGNLNKSLQTQKKKISSDNK